MIDLHTRAVSAECWACDDDGMSETVQEVPLSKLHENPKNPRKHFGNIGPLAESIEAQGIIEPIIVRKRADGALEISSGHRRARAAAKLGLKTVPVVVREMDEQTSLSQMIVENEQREGINPVELARGYQALIDTGLTADTVAKKVGASRSGVYAMTSLLKLPEPVQQALEQGKLNVDAARAITGVQGERLQLAALSDALKLAKPGEAPPSRAVIKMVQSRYKAGAKKGQSKHQREAKEHGADVALRRRVLHRLLARVAELVERRSHLDETDLRTMAVAHVETGGDSVREVFHRRGLHAGRLGKVAGAQLRSLVVELDLASFVTLVDGEYSPGAKAVARAYNQSLKELEANVEAEANAEALFKKR